MEMRRRAAAVKRAAGSRAPATPTARLPRGRRRDQLLETAQAIVRDEGTDALTLGHLAERAGVSKPVAYEHFRSRSGLLIALYQEIDEQHVTALRRALRSSRQRLEDVARLAGEAYMSCYTAHGAEWHAIAAAMLGDEQMEAVQQKLADDYVQLYCQAFAPLCDLPGAELQLRCVAILGAAEALSREMIRGRIDEKRAAAALASLIVRWLSQKG